MTEDAVEWARDQLRVVNLTAVRARPWAEVWRVDTSDGPWWLKVNSPATGYEAWLLRTLGGWAPTLVPASVSHPAEPWVLVADAGVAVREALPPGPAALAAWCDLLARYAEVQRTLPAGTLLEAGVPDARPGTLSELLDDLLADRSWQSAEVAPELTGPERELIAGLPGLLRAAADRLADGLPPGLQHDDLHGGNVFVDGQGAVRIIDWGDACVAHPFATLLVTQRALAAEWSLAADAPELQRLQSCYLEPWRTAGESSVELARQVDLALRTGGVARAASWRRALGTPEAGVAAGFGDAVAGWLVLTAEALVRSPRAPGP